MGRYEPLATHLRRARSDHWAASFSEIEKVLGAPLPESAHKYPAWWANQKDGGHSQSAGWQSAGWRTRRVDLKRKQVEFERVDASESAGEDRPGSEEELFRRASDYLGPMDRQTLIREAMRALVEREAGRRLARLGGTMNDFEVPPRRRTAP